MKRLIKKLANDNNDTKQICDLLINEQDLFEYLDGEINYNVVGQNSPASGDNYHGWNPPEYADEEIDGYFWVAVDKQKIERILGYELSNNELNNIGQDLVSKQLSSQKLYEMINKKSFNDGNDFELNSSYDYKLTEYDIEDDKLNINIQISY